MLQKGPDIFGQFYLFLKNLPQPAIHFLIIVLQYWGSEKNMNKCSQYSNAGL